MALPGILYPTSLPCWRLDSYNVAPGDVYAQVPWTTGENRIRRLFTTQQRTDSVHLTLTADEMAVFHDWFENVLQAGLMPFSAEMANLGTGLLWFQCQFLGPYRAEPVGGEFWQVTFDLLITGDGQAEPPDTSELGFAVAVPVLASAAIIVQTSFAFGALVPVLARVGQTDFAFDVLVPVLATVAGPEEPRITEDAETRITEDGETRILEQ